MVTTRITDAVPITIPRPVSMDRTGFCRSDCRLKLMASPSCMASALHGFTSVGAAAGKQAEHLGNRDPYVDETHAADAAAHVAVIPERMPGRTDAAPENPCEVVIAPAVGPRINEQEQPELEADQDQQHRPEAPGPARTGGSYCRIGGHGRGRKLSGLIAHKRVFKPRRTFPSGDLSREARTERSGALVQN